MCILAWLLPTALFAIIIIMAAKISRYQDESKESKEPKKKHVKKQEDELTMEIKDIWLSPLMTGKKVIECRLGNECVWESYIGREVSMRNKRRRIPVRITNVKHYADLASMLDSEKFTNDIPHPAITTIQDAKNCYSDWYSPEQIYEAGGIVALHFEVIV